MLASKIGQQLTMAEVGTEMNQGSRSCHDFYLNEFVALRR
jgi:hypothetical protein